MTGKNACFFCGSVAIPSTKRVVICSSCGISISNRLQQYLDKYLNGLDSDSVRKDLAQQREKLVEVAEKTDLAFLARVIAYHYLKARNYKKAREVLSELKLSKSRQNLRKAAEYIFGKSICLNECMINLFIEKAEDHGVDAETIDEGVRILKKLSARTSLTRSTVAAVFYLLTWMDQKNVADIFETTEVALRNSIKKHGLTEEVFAERAAKHGLDEEKIKAGLELLKKLSERKKEHSKTAMAAVFCAVSGAGVEKAAEIFSVSADHLCRKIKSLKLQGAYHW